MINNKTLYVTTRDEWRDWLNENFDKATEIWLVYPKKIPGRSAFLTTTPSSKLFVLDGLTVLSKHLTMTVLFNDLLQEMP